MTVVTVGWGEARRERAAEDTIAIGNILLEDIQVPCRPL
jgi:hypothetical protein